VVLVVKSHKLTKIICPHCNRAWGVPPSMPQKFELCPYCGKTFEFNIDKNFEALKKSVWGKN
jgi:uncharacterized Zn-finger protein